MRARSSLKAETRRSRTSLVRSRGRFFGMLVLLITVMTAVITAAFGCILVIGEEIGSYAAGAFIVAGIFCIAAAALFAFRKKLFRNTFVRLFIKLFYDNNE